MISSRQSLAAVLALAGTAGVLVAAAGFVGSRGQASPAADQDTPPVVQAAPPGPTQPTRPTLPLEVHEPTGLTAQEAIDAHAAATEGPEQPIPFNHKFHVREIGMQCAYCHGGTEASPVATIPAVQVCMGCHIIVGAQLEPIQDLKGYWEREEPIPWERVYKVPDFVQFPHEAHIRNDLACSECHGAVEDMDRIYQASSLRMGWCLECHMSEGEDGDYATDRLLSAQFPPPPMPEGRQPVGLYPRAIDQNYAETRGPIDCTACHY